MTSRFRLESAALAVAALFAGIAIGPAALARGHTEVHVGVHVDLAALFQAIDSNHDGAISQVEYTRHANTVFHRCDSNGDGKLSEQELQDCQQTMDQQGAPTRGDAAQTMRAMDTNHDGSVSKGEYDAYAGRQFEKMDTNHDGKLSPAELGHGVQAPASSSIPHPAQS